jgi:hypothetical protein
MILIAVSALLLRIFVEQIIKISIEQNESIAQTTLKLISTALENYAKANKGVFPVTLSVLTNSESRYLDKDYITQSPLKGYSYRCSKIEPSGYNCSAVPVKCNLTGKMSYSVSTGGLFVSEDCSKKEKE